MGVCEVGVGGVCELSLVPRNDGCMQGGCRWAVSNYKYVPKASFLTVVTQMSGVLPSDGAFNDKSSGVSCMCTPPPLQREF